MEEALAFAKEMGKGVYLMKVLGGGHLYRDPARGLRYAREFPHKDSVCVGMRDEYEVEFAARVLCGEDAGGDLSGPPDRVERRLLVEGWCTGCGECVKTCPFEALRVEEGRAQVERGKCMLCGYCARVCPHFCLKVV